MLLKISSVQDNSISIDAAMCPKRIVTGMLEFTGVLEYWSVGNSFFHYSITPVCKASVRREPTMAPMKAAKVAAPTNFIPPGCMIMWKCLEKNVTP